MRTGYRLGILAGAVMINGAAQAATAGTTFGVTLTLTKECLVSTPATLAFGSSGVLIANVDATTTFTVQCTNTTPYNIGLDAGQGAGASTTVRKLTGPNSATVNYGLFIDSGHSSNWSNAANANSQTGNGDQQSYTIYGRIPAQTTPEPGAYTDTIAVTVTY
ncbi:MAG: Csu type fimbrial protein [Xanthobacteraceae bacterium]